MVHYSAARAHLRFQCFLLLRVITCLCILALNTFCLAAEIFLGLELECRGLLIADGLHDSAQCWNMVGI